MAGRDGAPVLELGARHAPVLHLEARRAAAADLDRLAQGGDEPARVDRVVAGDVEREPHRRRERRLGAARLARAQPRHVEAERLAHRDQPVERLRLVGVARDDQRAVAAQARVMPGGLGQLGAEALVRAGAAQPELEQLALAELRLGDGREHARGDVPRAGLAGVEHERAQPARGGAPGAGEADRPAADDEDVWVLRCCHWWRFPPYAGTTRIRFDGRRPAAALSARSRAPVVEDPF